MARSSLSFLKWRAAKVLTAVLVIQVALVHGFARREEVSAHKPLALLPQTLGPWGMVSEGTIDKDTQAVLRAHDTVTRTYRSPFVPAPASLFVAYFETQRAGQAPHSPKNCLPGAGWVPSSSSEVPVKIPGREAPIGVNRYVVAKGESKSVVMYWYQSRDRVVADEYSAKFYVVADAIRHNRTDTALVRVVVPVVGDNVAAADSAAIDFIQSFFAPLRQHFPS